MLVRSSALVLGVAIGLVSLLVAAEALLGWSSSVRAFVGGGLVVIGSMLAAGGAGPGILFEKGQASTVTSTDVAQYRQQRGRNVSIGWVVLVVGVVVFASLFVLP